MSLKSKDGQIGLAVERLLDAFGMQQLVVQDHWPDDLRAIGVGRSDAPSVLAYIAAQDDGRFHVAFESPPGPSELKAELPYRDAGAADVNDLEELVLVVG